MISLDSLLSADSEDNDFEVKAAQGENGLGEVPRSTWESYSAMANTSGGIILLGIEQVETGAFNVLGVKQPNKVRKEFWDNANNPQIVSHNLLSDADVNIRELDGKSLVEIRVPRAARHQRPVYVGSNPMNGTYRRNFEGDYKCDEETVRRMLAEAVQPDRDSVLLDNYSIDDLDHDTLRAYRNDFKSTKPTHPWITVSDPELLRNLGGWRTDRASGAEGLTVAGLLMFGRLPAILEALPNYVLDYQEREFPPTERRWIDRLTTDGSWSGNLYDFYRKVMRKLTADLKVPFRTSAPGKRIDEDHVHEAIREALVNSLIHADFAGRISILIVKRRDMFGFRNPGGLRLPLSVVLAGGTSDCRNRSLQKMFQMVGAAEQAGSGIPKILRAWSEQHWRPPLLTEGATPENTVLRLNMVSLLPQEVLDELDHRFGSRFRELGETERLALATAQIEGKVTNDRLKSITPTHSRDLTHMFRTLVDADFLEPDGVGRGTCYYLPGTQPSSGDIVDGAPTLNFGSAQNIATDTSEHLAQSSEHLPPTSERLRPSSEHLASPKDAARTVRESGKVPQTVMIGAILSVCKDDFITLRVMGEMLGRSPDTLRVHYLNRLVRAGALDLRYPDQLNHPNQAYKTKDGQPLERSEAGNE